MKFTYQIRFFNSNYCFADVPLPFHTPKKTVQESLKSTIDETPMKTVDDTQKITPTNTIIPTNSPKNGSASTILIVIGSSTSAGSIPLMIGCFSKRFNSGSIISCY